MMSSIYFIYWVLCMRTTLTKPRFIWVQGHTHTYVRINGPQSITGYPSEASKRCALTHHTTSTTHTHLHFLTYIALQPAFKQLFLSFKERTGPSAIAHTHISIYIHGVLLQPKSSIIYYPFFDIFDFFDFFSSPLL
ncbi:hypothetical protein QBC44DRAFT_324438 [Cladorrhinum sp. PSN332]|nr:hypothetical protein QBC44DRAFT_324438 [Cladorrhinum sp. PSN332]